MTGFDPDPWPSLVSQQVRFFNGHMAWLAGLLQEEAEQDLWFPAEISPSLIFSHTQGEDLWNEVDPAFLAPALCPRHPYPPPPSPDPVLLRVLCCVSTCSVRGCPNSPALRWDGGSSQMCRCTCRARAHGCLQGVGAVHYGGHEHCEMCKGLPAELGSGLPSNARQSPRRTRHERGTGEGDSVCLSGALPSQPSGLQLHPLWSHAGRSPRGILPMNRLSPLLRAHLLSPFSHGPLREFDGTVTLQLIDP